LSLPQRGKVAPVAQQRVTDEVFLTETNLLILKGNKNDEQPEN
jgi:hypothetical protein